MAEDRRARLEEIKRLREKAYGDVSVGEFEWLITELEAALQLLEDAAAWKKTADEQLVAIATLGKRCKDVEKKAELAQKAWGNAGVRAQAAERELAEMTANAERERLDKEAAESRADGMERAGAEQARRADENAEWAIAAKKDAAYQRRHRKWVLKQAWFNLFHYTATRNVLVLQIKRAMMAEAERDRLAQRVKRLEEVLDRLADAADAYAADQSEATDMRCGLVQPVSVAEGEELNAALRQARAALEEGHE